LNRRELDELLEANKMRIEDCPEFEID